MSVLSGSGYSGTKTGRKAGVVTAELRVDAREQGRALVVRPIGRLDLSTYPALREELLSRAAEEPVAVVVDLDALDIGSPALLSLFAWVATRMAAWPAIPLAVAVTDPQARDVIRRAGLAGRLPVRSSVTDVLGELPPAAECRRAWQGRLPAVPEAAGMGRRRALDACHRWDVENMADDAVLLVSELVEFSVGCGCGRIDLRLELRSDGLSVVVHDDLRISARCGDGQHVDPWDVVKGLAAASGCAEGPGSGRTMWAVLRGAR